MKVTVSVVGTIDVGIYRPIQGNTYKGVKGFQTRYNIRYMNSMSPDTNPLYAWIKKQGMWGNGRGEVTHYFFDGGKARIPDGMENSAFNCKLFYALKRCPQYVVERRTQIFKLFMDLDIRIEEELTYTLTQSVVNFIKTKVDLFFVGKYEVIICTRSHVTDKTGIHLVWPKIITDSQDALVLRRLLIPACQEGLGNMFTNNWNDVIDKSVYGQNGFRMIGCVKGVGETSVYIPAWRVGQYGEWLVLSEGVTRDLIHETSIRYFGMFKTECKKPSIETENEVGDGEDDTLMHTTHSGLQWFNMATVVEELDRIKDQIIQETPEYANLVFKKMFKANGKEVYFIRATSTYCCNKKGFHCSSNVYFMITKDSIFQKCFSKKIKDGVLVQCKDYTGPRIKLHWIVQRSHALFDPITSEEEQDKKALIAYMLRGL